MVEERVLTGFADLLEGATGLATSESNRSHLRRVVLREARARSVTPEELLIRCAASRRTLQEIIDAAMIGETYFFREVAQFRYLREVIAPELLRRGTPITAWSASCSSGEEAISLAVLLHDAAQGGTTAQGGAPAQGGTTAQSGTTAQGGAPRSAALRVYAGDIRTGVAARIAGGEYPRSALRRDGAEYHALFLSRYVAEERERTILVSPTILRLIDAHTINLFADPLDEIPDGIDVVFFRNTLIYAPADNRERIVRRIVEKIRPGGYLFLASSELPFVSHPELELVDGDGVYFLRKTVAQATAAPPVERGRPVEPARPGCSAETVPPPPTVALASVPSAPGRWSIPDVVAAIAGRRRQIPEELADTARAVAGLFAELDEERFDNVDRYLAELDEAGAGDTVIDYCTAWVAYSRGDAETAVRGFGDVIAVDDHLWPAYFYRGRLREHSDPAMARQDFATCVGKIDGSPGDGLDFLVGGFDARQIRALCLRWIERIDAERVGSLHGS